MSENIIKRASSAKHYSVVFAISLLILTSLIFRIYAVSPALAGPVLPTGGSFAFGSGTISSSGPSMTVNQAASKGIINWQGFSIGKGGSVLFNNGQGATLNRVTGSSLSSIAGLLKATGSLYLINPNGIVITSTGSVITGGDFIASTLNISDSDFLNGNLSFYGSTGSVTNNGSIVSSGNTVLVGTFTTNNGTVSSSGTASMVSGTRLVLIPENGPSGILISPSSLPGNVTNSGIIKAASVYLSSSNGDVYALAGNNGGLIEATGTKTINGQVWLTAPKGAVSVNSSVTASGSGGTILIDGLNNYINSNSILNASGSGGVIKIGLFPSLPESLSTTLSSGVTLLAGGVNNKGFIDTSGDNLKLGNITVNANGGEWLLDPADFTIDSSNNAAIDTALGSGSVTITTASSGTTTSPSLTSGSYNTNTGDINIDAPVSWNSANTLTLSAYNSINVHSTITASGGGGLVLDYNTAGAASDYSTDTGVLDFPWAAGGGFAGSIQFTDGTNASGGSLGNPVGSLTINGTIYWLINDYNINYINEGIYPLTGNYALATDITSPSSFTPIGESNTHPFVGIFNGLGNTVNNLTIGSSAGPANLEYAGLFGQVGSGGSIENIGVTNEAIYNEYSSSNAEVGGLAGYNSGTITDSYSTGSVTNTDDSFDGNDLVGGLAGYNSGGISNSYSTGSVTNTDDSTRGNDSVGGLAGENVGIIEYSYSTGSVTNTDKSARYVDIDHVGGLAGYNGFIIEYSYSTGSVTNTDDSTGSGGHDSVGGLAGYNQGTIEYSYSTGSVTNTDDSFAGNDTVGGLAGYNSGGGISDSYSTGSVTNTDKSAGGNDTVGGLAGYSYGGTITDSYSTGSVTNTDDSTRGNDSVGGLAGTNCLIIEYSYYSDSISDTGSNRATDSVGSSLVGVTSLSHSQMMQSSNFDTSWGIITDPSLVTSSTVWFQYDGETYPLLRSFMTPLTVSANNASATYNGTAYTAAPAGVTYSPASPDTSNISGTLSYLNSSGSAPVNTGTYGLGGLYSNQQGYIISYGNGTLTINPYINNTIYHKPVYSSVFQALQANTPGGISGFSGNSFNELDAMLTGYEGSGLIPNIPSPYTGWHIYLKGFNRNNILGIPYGPTHKKRHNR